MSKSDLKFITENSYDLEQDERVVGAFLFDPYMEEIGKIQGLLTDPETYQVRYAVFTIGGFLFTEGKTVLLPREHYEIIDMGKIKTTYSLQSLQTGPTTDNLDMLTRNEERVILSYFDLEPYWDEDTEEQEEPPKLPGAKGPVDDSAPSTSDPDDLPTLETE